MRNITVTVGIRWWLKPWICLVLILNCATGWRPSEGHIQAMARRAVYIGSCK